MEQNSIASVIAIPAPNCAVAVTVIRTGPRSAVVYGMCPVCRQEDRQLASDPRAPGTQAAGTQGRGAAWLLGAAAATRGALMTTLRILIHFTGTSQLCCFSLYPDEDSFH